MQQKDSDNIVTLHLEDNISYKMYVSHKDTDCIQSEVFKTKRPYEYDTLKDMLFKAL